MHVCGSGHAHPSRREAASVQLQVDVLRLQEEKERKTKDEHGERAGAGRAHAGGVRDWVAVQACA